MRNQMMKEEFLFKYITGELSGSEKNDVVDWIRESEENLKEYRTLRRLYDISVWNGPESVGKRRFGWTRICAITAACIAVLLAVGAGCFMAGRQDNVTPAPFLMQSVTAPFGREMQIMLSDGTQVWLNAGSTIATAEDNYSGLRKVHLEGEAFFKVAPDAEHPFVVSTPKLDIKVLGTEFNVISDTENGVWETALFSGSVAILDKNEREILSIAPGTAITLKDSRLTATSVNYDKYIWKDGILFFGDLPLSDIFDQLSSYYDTDIRYPASDKFSRRCTGKFRTVDGLDHILEVLSVDGKFTFKTVFESESRYLLVQ